MTSEQKKTIIRLIDDWYLYSIAVIDPESTIWMLDLLRLRYPIAFQREEVAKRILAGMMTIHARYLNDSRGPVFFYSVAEYEIGKKNHSLAGDIADKDNQVREMIEVIEGNL